mgnify:CR=1 FL=1
MRTNIRKVMYRMLYNTFPLQKVALQQNNKNDWIGRGNVVVLVINQIYVHILTYIVIG